MDLQVTVAPNTATFRTHRGMLSAWWKVKCPKSEAVTYRAHCYVPRCNVGKYLHTCGINHIMISPNDNTTPYNTSEFISRGYRPWVSRASRENLIVTVKYNSSTGPMCVWKCMLNAGTNLSTDLNAINSYIPPSHHTYDCGLCCMPILRGYVMKTVGVTQMPVRYEAPLVLYHSQDLMDPESTTEEHQPWRPVTPTAEGLTL